ncbi:fructosamine kinase family protein [Rhodohalobacter halophilus]|uniref:fructosamine kinase family protein n=1 Tax=Rhodohalobacter halophilus TaxID=1812810 RepID=UPI00083FC374|nr:fructosamine kinase family protein [Rhodohalobacter halophilus]
MIPTELSTHLSETLDLEIHDTQSLSGGSINQAVKLSSNKGDYFLKWNRSAPDDFFEKEADGLHRLSNGKSNLRVPNVISAGKAEPGRPGYLLMEFIEAGRSGNSFEFGRQLATLHQTGADQFGLETDNYIGSLPQSNRQHSEWIEFFARERIEPQIKMAIDSGKLDTNINQNWNRLAGKLDEIFPPAKPSLLHGDLWSGNYLFDDSGSAVLIDPAVYYGHPEMDLAFTKMFGGFSGEFYSGYESESTLEAGFSDRVPIYNLYPLLVHVNLFGGHYVSQLNTILKNF